MSHISPNNPRTEWRRERVVRRWRRLQGRWWLPGREVDFAAVWQTWLEANDGDAAVALAHLLIAVERSGLLDARRRSA